MTLIPGAVPRTLMALMLLELLVTQNVARLLVVLVCFAHLQKSSNISAMIDTAAKICYTDIS